VTVTTDDSYIVLVGGPDTPTRKRRVGLGKATPLSTNPAAAELLLHQANGYVA